MLILTVGWVGGIKNFNYLAMMLGCCSDNIGYGSNRGIYASLHPSKIYSNKIFTVIVNFTVIVRKCVYFKLRGQKCARCTAPQLVNHN